MAQFLYKTVKQDGTGNYTSLEACMHANEQDLTSDGWFDVEIIGDWSPGQDTTACTIAGWVTPDANNNIRIIATGLSKHDGTAYKSTAYYRTTTITIGSGGRNLLLQDFGFNCGTNAAFFEYEYYPITHRNIVVKATSGNFLTINETASTSVLINCIYHGSGRLVTSGSANGVTAYNCTAYVTGSYGILRTKAINCYVGGADTACFFEAVAGSDYNVSSDTTADDVGTHCVNSVAVSTTADSTHAGFTNVTAGQEDLHIKVGSPLINIGLDESAVFTDDIDGTTRPTGANTWDIGADEYVAAGGATIKRRMLMGCGI